MTDRPKVAVLVGTKGRGSNMASLIRAGQDGRMLAEVALVVSPRADTPAVETAQNLRVPTQIHNPKDPSYAQSLLNTLQTHQIHLICLAGYMTLLPKEILDAFPNKVLNVHPALLPKFGGQGMYGLHVHNAVLAAKETVSGCTIHLVTEHYDEGPPLVQTTVPVDPSDTPETLAARVNLAEKATYPLAVNLALERQ